MDLVDLMQPLAILSVLVAGYILVFRKPPSQRKNGHYTLPDWNFYLKKKWAERAVLKKRKEQAGENVMNYKVEELKILRNENSSDSQLVYGSDSDGNSLLVKITRRRHRKAEVWLILRLKNGDLFTLPDHPDTRIVNASTDKFDAAGLTFDCIAPYSKWRINFNGYLRAGRRQKWSPNVQDADLKHIKFNFFWTAASDPLQWPHDWSAKLMATAIASEPWKDGQWMNLLAKAESGGYDQFGALFGQVYIQKNESNDLEIPEMEEYEFNLPGIRQRRWGPHKADHLHRTASIMGVCHDGSVYVIGANSFKQGITHSQFGNLRSPNGNVYPIDFTDFHLSKLAEYPNEDSKLVTTVRFSANKKMYTTVVNFRTEENVRLIGGRPFDWTSNITPLDLGLNGGRGSGVAILWYPFKSTNPDEIFYPEDTVIHKLHSNELKPREDQLVVDFEDREAQSSLITGGKGSSLALLTSVMIGNKYDEKDDGFLLEKISSKNRLVRSRKISKSDWNLSMTTNNNKEQLEKSNWKLRKELNLPDFIVPAGFVLTVSSFEKILLSNDNIRKSIQMIEDVAYGIKSGQLEEICKETVDKIIILEMDREVKEAIEIGYKRLLDKSLQSAFKLAVRSSAIGEDGSDTSSAGQNDTFLGLKTLEDVLIGVKKCWASNYAFQSVQYRRQHIIPIKTEMAVVVQTMVASECAGVLFTRHPTTGDPKKIVITANYGLGESVVSGSVDPDVFTIQRNYNDDKLNIITSKIGSKSHSINMTEDGSENVATVEINQRDKSVPCLKTDVILKLSEIGVALEKMYCSPRDIEWAIYKNQIYLLQARPITSLKPLTDWELLHELDTAVMSLDDCFTQANVGEVLPGTTTPLSITIIGYALDASVNRQVSGVHISGLFSIAINFSQYQAFMSIYSVMAKQVGEKIDMAAKAAGYSVFGHEFMTPDMHKIAKHRNGVMANSAKLIEVIKVAMDVWNNESVGKKMTKIINSFKGTYSEKNLTKFKTAKELLQHVGCSMKQTLGDVMDAHSHCSKVSSFSQIISMIVLTEGQEDLTAEHHSDIALLVGSCKDVESADVPIRLKEIAVSIFNDKKREEFSVVPSIEGVKWLEINCPRAFRLFEEFLNINYHRALKEFDLGTEVWGMTPEKVIEMVQNILKCDPAKFLNSEKPVDMTDAEIVAALKTPKKSGTRKFLKKLLPLCRKSIQRREASKSKLIAYIHEIRLAYRHISELMFREGLIPNKSLIFFLTNNEIHTVINTRDSNLITKAVRRQKRFQTWNEIRFPEILNGVPTMDNNNFTETFDENGLTKLTGTPVCAGIAVGRACVVKNFSETSQIKPGDILITHSTDIGWSPYFPLLNGIVTELGGIISHGAVVAREYGLPCIIGAMGATDCFKTGDKVKLFGDKGFIVKVQDDE